LKRQPSTIRRQPSRKTICQQSAGKQAAGKTAVTSEAKKVGMQSEINPMGTLIGHHRYTGKPRQLISRRKSYQRAMNHQNLTKTSRQNAIRKSREKDELDVFDEEVTEP